MSNFSFDIITLFPKAFEIIKHLGVVTRALDKNLINVNYRDLREYGEGSYRQVDDKPINITTTRITKFMASIFRS